MVKNQKRKIILNEGEYCYIINKRNGKINLLEGPIRRSLLSPFKEKYGIKQNKTILEENEYVIILNPYDRKKKEIIHGDREIRFGPRNFSLYYGEEESRVKQIPILDADHGLILKCLNDFESHKAGEIWIERGPLAYKPNKYIEIIETIQIKHVLKESEYAVILNPYNSEENTIAYGDRKVIFGPINFLLHYGEEILEISEIPILDEKSGLVIKCIKDFENRQAGEMWVEKGPIAYKPNKYSEIVRSMEEVSLAEHTGIYVKNTKTGEIRLERGAKTIMLAPEEELWEKEYSPSEIVAINLKEEDLKDTTKAFPLWVLENEVTKIMSEKEQKIIFGPKVILLNPQERPHVMSIAGGTPKNTIRLKIWKIKLGPNFSTDIIEVRTKDNAVLKIKLRYQWKFIIDPEDHEKIYGTNDFVGHMTEMMASIIRDEAAKHDFEELHSQASELIKKAIFGELEHYDFENGVRVFGIDIKEIIPKDDEIADRLNQAIKSNMEIYVNKMRQNAEIEAEKTKIEGQKVIEEEKIELIKVKQKNIREEELIKSRIEAEKIGIKATAEANAISIKSKAESDAVALEIKTLKETDKKYLELKRLENLSSIKKIAIVPTDSKLLLSTKELLDY